MLGRKFNAFASHPHATSINNQTTPVTPPPDSTQTDAVRLSCVSAAPASMSPYNAGCSATP